VIVIIAILATLTVSVVLPRVEEARKTAAQTDINTIMQALKLYKLDNQQYPTADQGLPALVSKPTTDPVPSNWKPYLEKLPNDPWQHPYVYLNPGIKGEVDVMSYGPSGKPGGEDNIGSWQ
ncbi:MAG: type II secretion system major pseudopilin GspG, partial [Burkholderiaceae bacterium]|nr:type II secretion system major pseudopilin GspG [Burkholderiaceae bacterium]